MSYLPHTRRIMEAIVDYAHSHGPWQVQTDPPIGLEPIHDLGRWKGDAVIASLSTPALAEQVLALGVPAVNISSAAGAFGLPCIWPDNAQMGRQGAEHLISQGLTHLAYCGSNRDLFSRERGKAFQSAAHDAGCACEIYGGSAPVRGDPQWRRRVRTLMKWLVGLPKPCGVMACDDYRAIAVLAACERAGLRVPEDLAVLGANDDDLACRITKPPLTSIPMPGYDIGYRAAERIDQALAGQTLTPGIERIATPPIASRESTDVLHYRHPDVIAAVRQIRRDAGRQVLTVEALAETAGVTARTLQQHFREEVGRTPKQEIDRVRTQALTRRLRETDRPVKQIAFDAGFASSAEFSRYFKRQTGYAPNHFRQSPPSADRPPPA
ncbi:MAG: XylR family transcriptional regulator [Planctomycetota bacterium]